MTDPSTREELLKEAEAVLPKLTGTLPVCPFDRRSPDYWTTANDKPCHVCGGTEAVDKCRGADLRCMDEAADLIRRLAAALQAAPPPGEGWRREHRFGAPSEPMSRPDEDWCDEYAAWFHAHPVFTHDHQI